MRVGRGGSERVKCACSRARAMRVVPILLFSKTGLGMSGVGGAHLCSRPAANSSSICSVTLFVRSSRSSRSSSKHTTKISLHTDKTWFQEWGGYARGEDICGERVCTRQGQTARLLFCSRGRPLTPPQQHRCQRTSSALFVHRNPHYTLARTHLARRAESIERVFASPRA